MYSSSSSLGAKPPRKHHSFEVLSSSPSPSDTTTNSSLDRVFSARSASSSSHTSSPDTLCSQQTPPSFKHTSYTSSPNDTPASLPRLPTNDDSDSRFDSLQDLLERAGYKETRVVTPDRHSLAGMLANKLATPPRKPRMVDDFSSDSPSLAASELRRAVHRSAASTSKSLPSRKYKLAADASSPPPLPAAHPAPSSSWFSSIWFFGGPGTIVSDPASSAPSMSSATSASVSQASDHAAIGECSTSHRTQSTSATASSSRAPPSIAAKKTASHNAVWTASVAYRGSRSHTAPVRKGAATSSIPSTVLTDDAAAEREWQALQKGSSNVAKPRRPGLVDAFASPTKKPSASNASKSQDSPSQQRKWRQERAAWRESLGDLQAMMDQSRMRREAAAAAKAAAEADEAALPEADAGMEGKAPYVTAAISADAALAKLLSGPALPFLSTDPAVAPRNGSCTRPTHLSLRRMKSVEVLGKIMRERRTVSSVSTPSAQASGSDAVEVDTIAGQISPRLSRRATPPKLTVSSPRGISSPKELALEGGEFEAASWSPARDGIIISNRRVAKKPRSRLRHAASGSDLRSAAAAAAEEASLETPSRSARRGRSKSR
ncbi:hypothetical protein PANT_19d00098, partial [Moesziomyces antarcticus T-34]